jgi:RNA polymerase sigma factor (sigma-70 family)
VTNAEQLVRDIKKELADGNQARELKAKLWSNCVEMVTALATRYTRNRPHLKEDFVSEAYLKFESVLPRFDPEKGVPFPAFLANCVKSRLTDLVRRRQESELDKPEQLVDRPVDSSSSHELGERILCVLSELLPEDTNRERKIMAFRLRYIEAWAVEDIAAWLKIERPNTVSQWIHRVRKEFIKEFTHQFPEYVADLGTDGLFDCGEHHSFWGDTTMRHRTS